MESRSPVVVQREGQSSQRVVVVQVQAIKTLTVNPAGAGTGPDTYRTLRDALDAAAKGDTIELVPGVYEDSRQINVEKSVHIVGRGCRGDVVLLRSGFGGSIVNLAVVGGSGSVRNVTLRPKKGSRGICGLHVRIGDWVVSDCDMSASAATGTVLHIGSEARATVERCWIHGGDIGIDMENGSVSQSDIFNCRDGILFRSRADNTTSVAHRNRLFENREASIWVSTKAQVLVEENEVWNGRTDSIAADKACSNATLRKNRLVKAPTDNIGRAGNSVGAGAR